MYKIVASAAAKFEFITVTAESYRKGSCYILLFREKLVRILESTVLIQFFIVIND